MQQWLSFHFYPLEEDNVFLTRALRPFLEQFIWPEKSAGAFFIRYADEKGPHIRLRIRGEAEWLQEKIRPTLAGWFAERGECIETSYEPEVERFGGRAAMDAAEAYFHLSTRVVLDRLNRPYTYGDAMFDALRMHAIMAFAAGLNQEKAAWYFGQLAQQWFVLFFRDENGQPLDDLQKTVVFEQFEKNAAAQLTPLKTTMSALWADLEKDTLDKTQEEWLRFTRGNQLIIKDLGDQLEKAMPSLLHLNNNRLGIYNQDEVYLNYLLSKVL